MVFHAYRNQGVSLDATSFDPISTDDADLSAFKARGGKLIQDRWCLDDRKVAESVS